VRKKVDQVIKGKEGISGRYRGQLRTKDHNVNKQGSQISGEGGRSAREKGRELEGRLKKEKSKGRGWKR